jgi:(S)-2-hydroxyglutarate dehydrogenase
MHNVDFLIIGGGIVGLTIAIELKKRFPKDKVLILEKEVETGRHSSGRNSGVLHSGIYYPEGTLKAKVCSQGARELAEYCRDKKLPINRIGKLLIPTSTKDAQQLELLQSRATSHGIPVEKLDEITLSKLEPETKSATGSALLVPSTSVGSSSLVMKSVLDDAIKMGVEIKYSAIMKDVDVASKTIELTDDTKISFNHLINAAGLHADSVAHLFGVGKRYSLLPFKGIYWKLDPNSNIKINHLIYPVPDLNVPFLGIHTTTSVDGSIYLGPTAVPAFGRENYFGLENILFSDFIRINRILIKQTVTGKDGFRRLAWQEGRRYFKPWFASAARALLPNLKNEHLLPCDKVGIRAQMYDHKESKLVNDFLVESGKNSTHILNAISPAWTSSFPFARHVIDNYILKD